MLFLFFFLFHEIVISFLYIQISTLLIITLRFFKSFFSKNLDTLIFLRTIITDINERWRMKIGMTRESNRANITKWWLRQIFLLSLYLTILFAWNNTLPKFQISIISLKDYMGYRIQLDIIGEDKLGSDRIGSTWIKNYWIESNRTQLDRPKNWIEPDGSDRLD